MNQMGNRELALYRRDRRAALGYVGLLISMLAIMAVMLVIGLYGCPSRAQTSSRSTNVETGSWASVKANELTMSGCKYLVVVGSTSAGIDVEVLHEPNCPNHASAGGFRR